MSVEICTYLSGAGAIGASVILYRSVRVIPNDRLGVRERMLGRSPKESRLVARHGEAGFQPDVLRGGFQTIQRQILEADGFRQLTTEAL